MKTTVLFLFLLIALCPVSLVAQGAQHPLITPVAVPDL